MPPQPFTTLDAFRDAFASGLKSLLEPDSGVGAYILAFNNAAFDASLRDRLGPALAQRFAAFAQATRQALLRGADPQAPPDDVAVFLRMLAVGYEDLAPVMMRQVGPWEAQFNPVRAFRPARASADCPGSLRVPFNPAGFHFNKPFLRPETFWSGDVQGRRLDLLFNKFPFVELQTILVPDPHNEHPQYLEPRDHHLAWSLTESLGGPMPGVLIGYNSLGASASVNHLHLHLTVRPRPLAAADPGWLHNGGPLPYPTDCLAFDRPDSAWESIDELQRQDRCFNLLYAPGRVYVLPRRRQGDYLLPDWCAGHAWYELAGGVICFDQEPFHTLEAQDIAASMARASLPHGEMGQAPPSPERPGAPGPMPIPLAGPGELTHMSKV